MQGAGKSEHGGARIIPDRTIKNTPDYKDNTKPVRCIINLMTDEVNDPVVAESVGAVPENPVEVIPEQSIQPENAPVISVGVPSADVFPPPVPEVTTEVPVPDVQKPPEVAPSQPWVVQMTYGMLRDLAARGRAGVQKRKRAKLDKILKFLDTHEKVTTHEVAHLLYVSSDTATRYLSQLEKEGKLKQVGKTGHAVYYVKP